MTTPSEWVTPTEAAAILGTSRNAVYHMVRIGRIPPSALQPRENGKGTIYISRAHLSNPVPTNVTAFPARPSIDYAQLADAILDAVIERLVTGATRSRVA